jgi:hypothetical protein
MEWIALPTFCNGHWRQIRVPARTLIHLDNVFPALSNPFKFDIKPSRFPPNHEFITTNLLTISTDDAEQVCDIQMYLLYFRVILRASFPAIRSLSVMMFCVDRGEESITDLETLTWSESGELQENPI